MSTCFSLFSKSSPVSTIAAFLVYFIYIGVCSAECTAELLGPGPSLPSDTESSSVNLVLVLTSVFCFFVRTFSNIALSFNCFRMKLTTSSSFSNLASARLLNFSSLLFLEHRTNVF